MTDTSISDGCVVCGPGSPRADHTIEEGMFRTGERFTYFLCQTCGSMQIAAVPEDLSRYYDPEAYYSFAPMELRLNHPWLRNRAARGLLRLNTEVFLRTGIGKGIAWARQAKLRPEDRILDLGCGWGQNLLKLHLYGFRRLVGSDPFIDREREVAPGVPIVRKSHSELEGEYDWVMMHHSFEHVADPRATLRSVRRLLTHQGRALIRMPIMGQAAWRRYGTNWVQLDPPRHLVLYTLDALRSLAESEGYVVESVFFDSTAFQFWGSELVSAKRPHSAGPREFGAERLAHWEKEARELNIAGSGDQAGIVLRSV